MRGEATLSISDVLAALRWWDVSVGTSWGTLPFNSGEAFSPSDVTAIDAHMATWRNWIADNARRTALPWIRARRINEVDGWSAAEPISDENVREINRPAIAALIRNEKEQ
jgi:hypothetical protein